MTRRAWVALAAGVLGLLVVVGTVVIMGLLTGEYWCADRRPWWGPPQDPDSTCSGHHWARDHPDDYPWTMPR